MRQGEDGRRGEWIRETEMMRVREDDDERQDVEDDRVGGGCEKGRG